MQTHLFTVYQQVEREVHEVEVEGPPFALAVRSGSSRDKFFHLVQRVKGSAKRPDCVLLR